MAQSGQQTMPPEPGGLPEEAPKAKTSWGKILAVVIVLVVIIAAVAVWRLGPGGQETPPAVTLVEVTSGAPGNVGKVNTDIAFRATTTGPVASYRWDFGDAANTTGTTNSATHRYAAKGTYLLLVTVTSPGGQTATNDGIGLLQLIVTNPGQSLSNESAVAVPYATPNNGLSGTAVSFDGNSSYGFDFNMVNYVRQREPYFDPNPDKISTWTWDFGDGSSTVTGGRGVANRTSHTYAAVGIFASKLTVQSSVPSGLTDSAFTTIRIAPTVPSGQIKSPDTLVIGSIGDPQYLDPAIDYETSGGEIIKNVYERLIMRAVDYTTSPAHPTINNNQIVGSLASSWTNSTDGLNWNFTIRSGIRFHDGTTLTATDVEYSLRRVLIINRGPAWIIDQTMTAYASDDPMTPINERWEAINASVVATDATHVEFHLAAPYGAFLYTLDFEVASILSKAWVEANGGTHWGARSDYISRHMMGTGPYKFDHWTPGVDLQLVKNTDYWGPTKPKISAVLYKQILDPATQELLLKNGDIDWAEGIPQKDIDMVKLYPNVIVEQNAGIVINYLGMATDNSWPGDPTRLINTSPFRDLHVRRAVSYAIDYSYMITTILDNYGYQMKSPVPQGMPFYNDTAWVYGAGTPTERLNKAYNEMALADPSLRGGFATEVWYNTGNPTRDQIAVMVQANLAQINISVTIYGVTWAELLTRTDYRQAPLFILGWAPDYLDPDDYVYPLFHSSACPSWIPGSGNPGESTEGTASSCLNNSTIDGWIEQAAAELNPAVRGQLYDQIQAGITANAPWAYLYQPVSLDPIRTWVKGYYFDTMELKDFLPIYKA